MNRLLLIICLLFSTTSFAQFGNWQVDNLGKLYVKLSYQQVIDDAKSLLKNRKSLTDGQKKEVLTKLAFSLYNINDYKQAEQYFGTLLEVVKDDQSDADILHKYAQVLAGNGKHSMASRMWKRYSEAIDGNQLASDFSLLQSNPEPLTRNAESYETHFLSINSNQADFSPVRYDGGIVFVSGRPKSSVIKRIFAWDNSPFLDLYFLEDESKLENAALAGLSSSSSTLSQLKFKSLGNDFYSNETANDGPTLGFRTSPSLSAKPKLNSENFGSKLNSIYHEGPCRFFNKDENIIFTRNGIKDLDYSATDGLNRVHLYIADRKKDGWANLMAFPFNSGEYSTGHPAFMPNEKMLFFVSDMPGGYGGTDIYFSKYEDGLWFAPQNAGSEINSAGNEMFPYIDENNVLFFSSDGHPGLGSLDIFSVSLSPKAEVLGAVRNLGSPINSYFDDFGILSDGDLSKGYFSSNRKNGGSDDDIYSFARFGEKYPCKDVLLAVKNQENNEAFVNLSFSYYEVSNETNPIRAKLNSKGELNLCLKTDTEYYFDFSVKGYMPEKKFFSTSDLSDFKPSNLLVLLSKVEKQVTPSSLAEPPQVMGRERISESSERYNGIIFDKQSKPMAGVRIRFVNKCTGFATEFVTSEDGKYDFSMDPECDYEFIALKTGFAANYEFIPMTKKALPKLIKSVSVPFVSKKTTESFFDPKIFKVGDVVKLDNIYYESKDFQLASASKNDLDQLIRVMEAYPDMVIEIFSHTDSRGNADENLILSQKRANEVKDYISKKGVDPLRIKAIGMGEKAPVNQCGDGVQCTEAEHRRNRRTEFKILQIERI